jgi:hypothetical protein
MVRWCWHLLGLLLLLVVHTGCRCRRLMGALLPLQQLLKQQQQQQQQGVMLAAAASHPWWLASFNLAVQSLSWPTVCMLCQQLLMGNRVRMQAAAAPHQLSWLCRVRGQRTAAAAGLCCCMRP